MKVTVLSIAAGALAASLAMPASAQSGGQWYIGGGVGSASTKDESGSVSTPAGTVSITGDDRKTSWKVLGGYQFTETWGLEGQYTDLGNRNINASLGAFSASKSVKPNQWSLAGTGKMVLGKGFFLHGKLGVTRNDIDNVNFCFPDGTCVGSGSNGKTSYIAGIGIGHTFNKQWTVKGGYETFGKFTDSGPGGNEVKIDNVGINVLFSF